MTIISKASAIALCAFVIIMTTIAAGVTNAGGAYGLLQLVRDGILVVITCICIWRGRL